MSLLATAYLCWRGAHTPPLLRLVNPGSLNDADDYLVTHAQATLRPIAKLVGTTGQTAHSEAQLLSTKAACGWMAKNPAHRRGEHGRSGNTCRAFSLAVYVNLECDHSSLLAWTLWLNKVKERVFDSGCKLLT